MPLHLLGKKSWNVYNADNVDRVRRDEADARAREEAADQLMQEQDAERRIALLRGEKSPALPAVVDESRGINENERAHGSRQSDGRERKRRRLKGEDDTEREMRYAREDAEAGSRMRDSFKQIKSKDAAALDDAPLQDRRGHIQLVPAPEEGRGREEKSSKEEKTSQRKKSDEEQSQGMRFSDAAGYRKGMDKPWYTASSNNRDRHDNHKSTSELVLAEVQGKDVWGNEDPRRVDRERQRVTSSDPFAMMQQAQKQLKRSEGDREKWQAERDREMQQLKDEDRKRRHERNHESRRSRRREDETDGPEGFSLDEPAKEANSHPSDRDGSRRHRHSRRHRSRDRSRSRSREHRRR
jgi:hypothetical protein